MSTEAYVKYTVLLCFILSGCASGPGETYRKNYYLFEYTHEYGDRPKLHANLPNNFKFRAKGYYDSSGGEKIVYLQWKVDLDAYMNVHKKSKSTEFIEREKYIQEQEEKLRKDIKEQEEHQEQFKEQEKTVLEYTSK